MKTLVFDFGNVVAFFDHFRALERLAAHSDLTPGAMFEAVYEGELEDAYEAGRISSQEFLTRVRKLCRLRCDLDTLAATFVDIFQPNPETCGLIPELKKKYRLLLGSNTNELHSAHFLRQFAAHLCHFDALVLSHEVGARKPHPRFFERCSALAQCDPQQCLFIDDLPANVAGATALGWHGLVYVPGTLRERLKDLGVALADC